MAASTHRTTTAALGLAALLSMLAGCGGGHKLTKEGQPLSRSITLKMETPDSPQANARFFADRVAALTHGRVQIVEAPDYSSADPDNELRLAAALREGRAEMAYMPSRAWERDGGRVLVFRALQAPFLIRSYGVLHAVATGPIGRGMLASLRREGLVGLGLVPDELRRVLSRRPMLSASDFHGARIRVATSPTSSRVVEALGAKAVTGITALDAGRALAARRLEGIESSTQAIANNDYAKQAQYLASNLGLFPKTQTIAITRAAFDRLSSADRRALQEAASATAAHADPAAQERAELSALCAQGLRVVRASSADIASLRRRTASVYALLERDPATRRAIAAIQRLGHQAPAADSSLASCPLGGHSGAAPAASAFPTGTFETDLTRAEVVKAGFPADHAHRETLTFRKDGTWWDVWFHPRRTDQPPGGGHYTVQGDTLTLRPAGPDVVRWSYFRGQLTFRVVSVPDDFAQFTYTAHPWRKIR